MSFNKAKPCGKPMEEDPLDIFGVTVLGVLPFFEKPCRRDLDAWGSSCEEEPLCDEVVVGMEGGGKVE